MGKRGLLAGLLALACLLFAALGVWQVQRRAWKLDLIAAVDSRIHAAPRAATPAGAAPYTRLAVAGNWIGGETRVQAVTELGPGFWAMAPLRTDAGWTLLVNRGFVPAGQASETPPGRVTVTGLLRETEPGGAFLRHNDPAADRWFSRDVAAIAAARGLGAVAPYFIDAEAGPAGTWPVGGLTVVAFRNSHLVYAATWFGLAALSVAGLIILKREHA